MRRAFALVLGIAGLAGLASAQPRSRRDAGAALDAGPSPRAMVDALRGGLRAVDAFPGAQARDEAVERAFPLARVMPGRCYALVGAATGAAQVRVRVIARTADVVPPTPIANSRGEAVRRDFCARYPTDWFELLVAAEGAAQWHVALLELPGDASAPPEPSPRALDAGGAEDVSREDALSFRPEPVGGTERDYVGAQLRAYARARPRLVGFAPAVRRSLATNEAWAARFALPAGRCVELVAAGVPSVGDFALELEDPGGARVAQDGTHRATEALRHCPRYAGSYTARVRMFAGAGAVAIQLLTEP